MKRLIAILLVQCALLSLFACTPLRAESASVFASEREENARITRFLLLGCDRSTKLTDSILLVTVNETAKEASILQIPRDTYAEYTERDYKKLNGAMSALGEKGMKDFLSQALGVSIHYFVVLKLDFFRELVDAVGGVDVDIPQDMVYSDPEQNLEIRLSKGPAHLDGNQAEQFVRYRSGYVNADLGRLDAQKLFLRAFAKQCKTLSWSGILRVLMHALTGVQTDLGIFDAVRVLKVLLACDVDSVPMATMPGQAVQGKSGAWYYVLNREGASRTIGEYLSPTNAYTAHSFDPHGLFDRESNDDFHRIYWVEEKRLPIV